MRFRQCLLASFVVILPLAAVAEERAGTREGATALRSDLEAFTGKPVFDLDVIKINPDPGGYKITIDLLKAVGVKTTKVTAEPYSIVVSARPDGTYDVSSHDGFSASFDTTLEGMRQAMSFELGDNSLEGIFSPAVGSFLSAESVSKTGHLTTRDEMSNAKVTFGALHSRLTGTPVRSASAPAGAPATAVDFELTQTVQGFEEFLEIKAGAAPGASPPTVSVKADTFASTLSLKGFESRALLDLWAFAIAHAEDDEKALVGEQRELKSLMRRALPILSSFSATTSGRNISLRTNEGSASFASLETSVEGTGASERAEFGFGAGVTGLSFDTGDLPAWVKGLLPTDAAITLRVTGLDLATPARKALDDLDLSRDPPISEKVSREIEAAFASAAPILRVDKGRLKSDIAEVTFEGEMTIEDDQPPFRFTIEASGLDAVIAKLQKASQSDPSINEAVGALAMAKGFAKSLPDGRSQWTIVGEANGAISLNNFQIQPPAQKMPKGSTSDGTVPG